MLVIDGYVIDASLSEDHSREADVTSHPVEVGANIADHVRPQPMRVTIDGIVSDAPIGDVAELRGDLTQVVPPDDALDHLERIFAAREPVQIETDLKVYPSMILQSLSIPVNPETGYALRFSATFCELILVTNRRALIRVGIPRAANAVNRGNRPVADTPGSAPAPAAKTSAAAAALKGGR